MTTDKQLIVTQPAANLTTDTPGTQAEGPRICKEDITRPGR